MVHQLIRGHRSARRLLLLIMAVALALSVHALTQAQGGTSHKIKVGDTVTGTLNAKNVAQVYSFDANAKDTVAVSVVTKAKGLTLGVLLTDAEGQTLGQSTSPANATVAIKETQLPNDGTYYITVLRGTGTQGDTQGDFTLTLSGTNLTVSDPQTVALPNGGLSVALTWASTDDLDLEVRDPTGGEVNFRNTSVRSGGKLNGNINANCKTTTSEHPTETIAWPKGNVPGGSYEIIVYFNQACTKPATPQNFTVTISVDGKAQDPISGTINENQQYVASFILAGVDKVTVNQGGADPNVYDRTTISDKLTHARPLNNQTEVNGTINRNNAIDAWSFDGITNQTVTISMSRSSGNLDSLLYLFGPRGDQLAFNDDASNDTRDARIANFILPVDGRYVIIATRFGLRLGGTEGNYNLAIGGKGRTTVTQSAPTSTPSNATTTSGLPDGSLTLSLTWNSKADIRMLIRTPSGASLFTDNTQLPDSGTLQQQGNLNCKNVVSNPQTYAFWPVDRLPTAGTYEIQVWLISQCNEVIQPEFNLSVKVNGTEAFSVKVQRPDITNPRVHYVTSFTLGADGAVTQGAQGTFGQLITDIPNTDFSTAQNDAKKIAYNTPVNGTINETAPFQVYSFQAKAGDRVRINLRFTKGNLDPFLFLLDSGGLQINSNDDVTPGKDINARIDHSITVDGTYYVVATRYGATFGGTAGNYELSVGLLNR